MIPFHDDFPHTSPRLALAPAFTDHLEDIVLAPDTLVRVPVPSAARFVLFSFDADVRVRLGTAALSFALPLATTGDGSGSELNPVARRLPPAPAAGDPQTHVLLRAPGACPGSVSFYG